MSRLQERIERIFALGDRIGYTAAEDEAHVLARGWMVEAGLEVEGDDAGNLIGRVPGAGREVWTGSHLDSVPSGGRFDGVLGVLGGLEAVERLGLPGLAVVAFRDEERGCAGSRARVASGAVPEAYLELHIEQGPRLERADAPLAAVTGIVGYSRRPSRSPDAPVTPDDADWRAARTRSSPRRSGSSRSGKRPRRSTTRSRPSGRSASTRAAPT